MHLDEQQIGSALASVTPDLRTKMPRGEIARLDKLLLEQREIQGILPPEDVRPLDVSRAVARLYEPSPELDDRAATFEAEQLARTRNDLYSAFFAQIGKSYAGKALDNFQVATRDQKEVVEELTAYCNQMKQEVEAGRGIVLYGPCGTGKDHLLCGVMRCALAHGQAVTWVNGQDWLGDIRDDMDSDRGLTERRRIATIAKARLLVLSDPLPPSGPLGPHMSTMLYRMMVDRVAAGFPTYITLNVQDDAEADRRLGTPTWDRMHDNAWKMFCNWPSFRAPHRKVNC